MKTKTTSAGKLPTDRKTFFFFRLFFLHDLLSLPLWIFGSDTISISQTFCFYPKGWCCDKKGSMVVGKPHEHFSRSAYHFFISFINSKARAWGRAGGKCEHSPPSCAAYPIRLAIPNLHSHKEGFFVVVVENNVSCSHLSAVSAPLLRPPPRPKGKLLTPW